MGACSSAVPVLGFCYPLTRYANKTPTEDCSPLGFVDEKKQQKPKQEYSLFISQVDRKQSKKTENRMLVCAINARSRVVVASPAFAFSRNTDFGLFPALPRAHFKLRRRGPRK